MTLTKRWRYAPTAIEDHMGLAADTKPTSNVPYQSTFLETDTGRVFIYNGSAWVQVYGAKLGKTYREVMTERGYAWVENFLIDVGNDLTGDIDTTYTCLSLIGVHTLAGSNTLAVVNSTGFTGDMFTTYEVLITKAGVLGTAEFKWRSRSMMGGVGGWSGYTEGVVTAVDNDLGDNVVVNFTGVTSVLNDKYYVHGKPSWHTPADGYIGYLTSFGVRTFDSNRAKKIGYARVLRHDSEVWEHIGSEYHPTAWSTPMMVTGDGTRQFCMEFKEVTKGDIEFVVFEMKGWDEPA